jgi:hypothetical protein
MNFGPPAKPPKPFKYDSKNPITNAMNYVHNSIQTINSSKIFAGLMIIVLNIASKFVNIKVSKSMEAYLKYTFSKQILVFAIAWMGTRDIYIALIITIVFIIVMDFLLNEESMFCCLPETFTNYHIDLLNNNDVSKEELQKAKEIMDKAGIKYEETPKINEKETDDFMPFNK